VPTVVVDSRRVSYEDQGAGRVAVLIHGSPGNGKAWKPVADRLVQQCRVIAPDLPGYGETTAQPRGQDPDVGYACALVEELIRHAGSPIVLAGHSYGGVVALAVALRARVPVRALALFEPVAVNVLALDGDPSHAASHAYFDDYIRSVERGDAGAVRKMVDFWFGDGAFGRMPEPLTAYLTSAAASNIRDVRATLRETYTAEALGALRMPVAIVVGDRSPAISHRIAHAIARHVPRGFVTTVPNATHALVTTHPERVIEAIERLASEAVE